MKDVHALLSDVLAPTPTNAFQDSDGLISFVNLSTSFVQDSREFTVGQRVCDKISNFFSTLRIKIFASMQSGKIKPLSGDQKPTTQWDPAVTHYIQYLLAQAGGLTNFHIVTETYSYTQVMSEFSTAFVKLLFDAAVVPELVITDITNFLQGVGDSLRASWDNRSRTYQTILLAQCHEAVPEDASGKDFRYFPKIKYYYINIDSSQTEFSTPCSRTESITFNFTYEYYVTGLAADVLDEDTKLYGQFVTNFLDLAQATNYKDAKNNLNSILDGTTSGGSGLGTDDRAGDTNVYGVAFSEYPLVKVGRESANARLEDLLNQR